MKILMDSVDSLASVMTFHRDRHAVLAGNVANVDTPGYVPFDLEAPLDPSGEAELVQKADVTPRADGNAVSMEQELAKIDANRVRYNVASQVVSKKLALMKYTAGDGT